jgi:hypothetical protein
MSDAFDKLKQQLEEQDNLAPETIEAVEAELGPMTDEERMWLSAEQHDRADRAARAGAEITLEQYVAATQTLDSAEPGSPEYEEAQRIVEAFESAA